MLQTFTSTQDNLIAGHFPLVTETVTIAASQTIVRGSVLGKIDTGGQCVLSLSASIDGSEVPYAIAAEPVTTGVGETAPCVAYMTGEFAKSELTLGTGHTLASIKDGLRDKSIFLKDSKGE